MESRPKYNQGVLHASPQFLFLIVKLFSKAYSLVSIANSLPKSFERPEQRPKRFAEMWKSSYHAGLRLRKVKCLRKLRNVVTSVKTATQE
jgi:hypothetical protein